MKSQANNVLRMGLLTLALNASAIAGNNTAPATMQIRVNVIPVLRSSATELPMEDQGSGSFNLRVPKEQKWEHFIDVQSAETASHAKTVHIRMASDVSQGTVVRHTYVTQ